MLGQCSSCNPVGRQENKRESGFVFGTLYSYGCSWKQSRRFRAIVPVMRLGTRNTRHKLDRYICVVRANQIAGKPDDPATG